MKKLIGTVLCFLLLFQTVAYGREAEKSISAEEGMRINPKYDKLVKLLENKLKIPKELLLYEAYRADSTDDEEMAEIFWGRQKDIDQGISVTSTLEGGLLSYYKSYSEKPENIAAITYGQGSITAREFVRKVLPEYYSQLRLTDTPQDINEDVDSELIKYAFQYYKNDIPVFGCKVIIGVSKLSNEVSSFDANKILYKGTFEPNTNLLSMQRAKKDFRTKIPIDLVYRAVYVEDDKGVESYKPIPLYQIVNTFEECIDAKTGKK